MSKCKVTRNSCKKEHLDKKLFGEQLQGTIFYLHTNCHAVDVDYNGDDDAAAKRERRENWIENLIGRGKACMGFRFQTLKIPPTH